MKAAILVLVILILIALEYSRFSQEYVTTLSPRFFNMEVSPILSRVILHNVLPPAVNVTSSSEKHGVILTSSSPVGTVEARILMLPAIGHMIALDGA